MSPNALLCEIEIGGRGIWYRIYLENDKIVGFGYPYAPETIRRIEAAFCSNDSYNVAFDQGYSDAEIGILDLSRPFPSDEAHAYREGWEDRMREEAQEYVQWHLPWLNIWALPR